MTAANDTDIVHAIDWGHGNKLTICDGKRTWAYEEGLRSFVIAHPNSTVVIENTFESYHRSERNAVIDEAAKANVTILTVPTRATANHRKAKGIEKSDEADALVIFEIWREQRVHLALPQKTEEGQLTRMKRVELLRRRAWPKVGSEEFLTHLPKDIPAELLAVLGDGKKLSSPFCLPLVATALDVLDAGGGRNDFERKVGCYGHGHPSLLRSHFYYWRLRAIVNSRMGVRSTKTLVHEDVQRVRKEAMRELRRAVRWLFSQVRKSRSSALDNALELAA